jgi:hypothetical protein
VSIYNYVSEAEPISIFVKKNPARCNNITKFYFFVFILSSTCFGQHTARHQEPSVMYVNLEIENFNFDICKWNLCLKNYVETVTVRPVAISWLRNEEL